MPVNVGISLVLPHIVVVNFPRKTFFEKHPTEKMEHEKMRRINSTGCNAVTNKMNHIKMKKGKTKYDQQGR